MSKKSQEILKNLNIAIEKQLRPLIVNFTYVKDITYFLQTLHNGCFQTEIINDFLCILRISIKVTKVSSDKVLVI